MSEDNQHTGPMIAERVVKPPFFQSGAGGCGCRCRDVKQAAGETQFLRTVPGAAGSTCTITF